MKFQLSQRTLDHSIQAILIFASVLLAFWMNEYRIHRAEERVTQDALEAILSEVESNLGVLERWTPYHQSVIEKTQLILENPPEPSEEFSLRSVLEPNRGIFRELLTDNVWNYLNQAQVRVEMRLKLEIARVYEQQEYVEDALKDLFSFLKERETIRSDLAPENWEMFYRKMSEVHAQETAMIESYKGVVARLQNEVGQ